MISPFKCDKFDEHCLGVRWVPVPCQRLLFGMPLDRFAFTVMALVAALPSASSVSLLAERIGADNGRIASIILVSTVAAFVTFSLAVALMT